MDGTGTVAGAVFVGPGDTGVLDRSDIGDAERLRQFLSHKSGVIRCFFDADPLFSLKCGFISKWAWVSLQNICILYWFKHLSEQNCSCEAPS